MHTSLRVTGVLSDLESSVVLCLGFGRWDVLTGTQDEHVGGVDGEDVRG
jgi:hypothetical protein